MFTIRAATSGDLDQVVELWGRAGGPSRHPGGRLEVGRLLVQDPGALLVAHQDTAVVGTVIVGWDGWRCHLYRLAVEQSVRRSGIARALVAAAQMRAEEFGAVRLDAMVNRENAAASGFWEAIGFRPDPHDDRWSLPL